MPGAYSLAASTETYKQLGEWVTKVKGFAQGTFAGVASGAVANVYNRLNFGSGEGAALARGSISFDTYLTQMASVVGGLVDVLDSLKAQQTKADLISWWNDASNAASQAFFKDKAGEVGQVLVDGAAPITAAAAKGAGVVVAILLLVVAIEVLR